MKPTDDFSEYEISVSPGVYKRSRPGYLAYEVKYRTDDHRQHRLSAGRDKDLACSLREDIRRLQEEGIQILGSDLTVEELLKRWLEEKEHQVGIRQLSEDAFIRYRTIAGHFDPLLTRYPGLPHLRRRVRNLFPSFVGKFEQRLEIQGYAPETRKLATGVLQQVLDLARRDGAVAYNAVKRWKADNPQAPAPRHNHGLKRSEFERLLQAAEPRWRCLLFLAGETGAHTSELLSLRYRDVAPGQLRVGRHLNDRTRTVHEYPPADRRRRTILLSDPAHQQLLDAVGPAPSPDALLFPGREGRCRSIRAFDFALKRASSRARLDVDAATLRATSRSQLTPAPGKSDASQAGS